MTPPRVSFTFRSGNRKTGPIPVSMTESVSCPQSCPLHTVCYAKSGGPVHMQWLRLDSGRTGYSWDSFLHLVQSLPKTIDNHPTLWRHNAAGDLPGHGDHLDIILLEQLVAANGGRAGYTYTHKPLRTEAEREAIRSANANGFTINLSAHGPVDADRLADLGIAPVVTVMPVDAPDKFITPKGRTIVVCPAYKIEGMTCSTCRACAIPTRKTIIGFPLHGQKKNKITIPLS